MYYSTWIELIFFSFIYMERNKKKKMLRTMLIFFFFKSYGGVGGCFWIVMWA